MAYTDKKGTTIAAGDTVAAAVRYTANEAKLIIGVISGPYTARGRTYFEINKGSDAQGSEDRGRTVITMSGAGAGQCKNAVKSGFASGNI